MFFSLSKFSIRQQILIGYIPVLIVLGFLAFSSFQNTQKFDQSFVNLRKVTQEKLILLKIERDIVELQRNVLVYSYVGYRGVLRKIEFVQKKLDEKFDAIKPIVDQDEDIKDRYDRMLGHYNSYNAGFLEAIKEKNRLNDLNENSMAPLIERSKNQLNEIQVALVAQSNFEDAYDTAQTKQVLLQASFNIDSFSKSSDSLLMNETQQLISGIQNKMVSLKVKLDEPAFTTQIDEFLLELDEFQNIFKKITRINRTYMHLINVVLAGKAAEMTTLSDELDVLILRRAQSVSAGIQSNIDRYQNQFITLSIFAGLLGIVSSIFIAMGIAKPVSAMAKTLSELSKGQADIEIPGQERRDEVGQMAEAANEFKIMAQSLESQTEELEEFAYRTSHDLRSPLVSSIALLGMASKDIDQQSYDNAKKSMSLVGDSLSKLDVLVKDILELTKTKNLIEDTQDIDLNHIINDVLQKLAHMDNFERLSIQTDLQLNEMVKSQESRITLIVGNLISNAIKYQDLNKNDSFVKVSTYSCDGDKIVEVEDNGLGIPEKHQEQLFTMFKRFHPKVSFGSGLGLYMMKKSADIIGATLVFEDTGHGSKFKLLIPQGHRNIKS